MKGNRAQALLVADFGTSGAKSSLLIRAGGKCALLPSQKSHAEADVVKADDVREWSPEGFIKELTRTVIWESIRARHEKADIDAIAITTTTSSLAAVDDGMIMQFPPPLRWDDRQSSAEAIELESIRARTGAFPWLSPISPDSGIAKAYMLIKRYQDLLAPDSVRLLEQWSLANYFLSGEFAQSEPIMSRKWGCTARIPWPDAFHHELDAKLKPHFGRRNNVHGTDWLKKKMLPGNIVQAGDLIGKVPTKMLEPLGLFIPPRVVAAPYDTSAQILGLGLLHRPNALAVSFGTSLGIAALVPLRRHPKPGTLGQYPDVLIRGRDLLLDGIASCGSAINYLCERFNVMTNGAPDFAQIERALSETRPGAANVRVLPYFNGGRRVSALVAPEGKLEGLRHGIGGTEVMRALFESIAYIVRVMVEDFENLLGKSFKEILVGGGPARNNQFMQLLADITGRHVCVSAYRDSSLVGCAVSAAVGAGWFPDLAAASRELVAEPAATIPNPANTAIYDQLFQKYKVEFAPQIMRPGAQG